MIELMMFLQGCFWVLVAIYCLKGMATLRERRANKIRRIRDRIDATTPYGQKRIKELNAEIDSIYEIFKRKRYT